MTALAELLATKCTPEAKCMALHLASLDVSSDPKKPTHLENFREASEKIAMTAYTWQQAWIQLKHLGWVSATSGPDQLVMPADALPRRVLAELSAPPIAPKMKPAHKEKTA